MSFTLTQIPNLPPATSLDGTELVVIVQGGVMMRTTTGAINGILSGRWYTVAGLPAATSQLKGQKAFVTDSVWPPALGAVAAGGGTIFLPVYCDGVAWRNG